MPGEDVQSWSITAANNGTADTLINWAEGQPRASVNNSARSQMAAHAKDRNLKNGSIVTGGTANAQTFTSGVGYTAVPTGLVVKLHVGPGRTNTGNMTLNMDGIGATSVTDYLGAALVGGEFLAGNYVDLLYNGSSWIVLGATLKSLDATKPAFRANLTVDQASWPASSWINGLFNMEVFDVGSYYDTASQFWQPPAGKILIGGQGEFSDMGTNNHGYIGIYKNSAPFARMQFAGSSLMTSLALNITALDNANGTDFYQLAFNISSMGVSGATLLSSTITTAFFGHRL